MTARVAAGIVALVLAAGAGCRQDMHDQPKYKPLARNDFFADHRAVRPRVEGTIARGHLEDDSALNTGKSGDAFTGTLPLPLTLEMLRRGRMQFEVYCSPCHGRTGRGDGMIVERGFKRPGSYHTGRLRQMPVGYFHEVITHGFGAMADYAGPLPVEDRWAVAAYVRALQLSQHAPLTDVPAAERAALDGRSAAPAAAAEHHP